MWEVCRFACYNTEKTNYISGLKPIAASLFSSALKDGVIVVSLISFYIKPLQITQMMDAILQCALSIPANAGYHHAMCIAYTRKCGIPSCNVHCLYPQMRDTIMQCALPIPANA